MEKQINLDQLVSISGAKRDAAWEQNLLAVFADSSLFMVEDQPFQGPDGYSYVAVTSNKRSEGDEAIDIKDLLNWCYETGVGLVFNLKDKDAPDFVFTNGMIWNYVFRGNFVNQPPKEMKDTKEAEQFLVHEISEGYLPRLVRSHIKEFLDLNGFKEVKLSLLSGGDQTAYQIIWYSDDFLKFSEKEGQTLLEAISWFLPSDYQMGIAKEYSEELRFSQI